MLDQKEIEIKVLESLKKVIDPELGIDIVELGLIRKIEIGDYLEDFKVYEYIKVVMTLTSVMCPFADEIISQVESQTNILNFGEAQVELDFTEPWEPSEELKMKLGI
ncbi:MAG: metal-sulfur cluster assembly factor [Candidatus Pacebacteria bacterium]|nr:metal-sulfur cluster assembly factor [Candidatus Paceibacterota bacterium]